MESLQWRSKKMISAGETQAHKDAFNLGANAKRKRRDLAAQNDHSALDQHQGCAWWAGVRL